MPNPLNPLEWLRTAQDWFAKTERSSGFRPYLIYLILASGVSLSLLVGFRDVPEARLTALILLGFAFGAFVFLFGIKAFQDPDFCRSETHLHRMKKLELEFMGSDTEALPAEVIEDEPAIEAPPAPKQIEEGADDPGEAGR